MFCAADHRRASARPGKGVRQPRGVRHRHRSQPGQTARLRFSLRRDLRRHEIGVGLRSAGRRAQREHQTAMVAFGGHRPRRRRRTRFVDHPAAAGVGGLRPRRGLQRPAGRVADHPQALSRRPPHRGLRGQAWAAAAQRAGRHPRPGDRRARPVDRAPRVQHDAQDLPRDPSRPRRGCTICAPRPRRASSSTSPTW